MKDTFKRNLQKGFTLVELLIVVIILAILAAIVVPQFSSSTTDANDSASKTNLAALRSAIELYAAQHNGKYPGAVLADGTGTATTAGQAPAALVAQLTLPTDATGKTNATKTAAFPFGPYIRGTTLPTDPNATSAAKNDVAAQTTGAAISAPATTTAYFYDTVSGQIVSTVKPAF